MTLKQISELKKGEIIHNGDRYLEVEDISRLREFGDIEVWNLEPNEVGDLVRADWDTLLFTIPELMHFTKEQV